MAGVISSSGLAGWIAESLGAARTLPVIVLIVLVTLVIIFLTEVTSNTATAAAFLPLLGALAMSQDVSPLLLTVPAAIAASCAFMMPVATPPNARSEEHTSELQSRPHLVCRLLLEKKNLQLT